MAMTSRERVLTALRHKEPDRVPFDMGGSFITGINVNAYRNLLSYLGIKKDEINICDTVQQLAEVHEDVYERFGVDVRGFIPQAPSNWRLEFKEENGYISFTNEWGITWSKPKDKGFYFDMTHHPLGDKTIDDLATYNWPLAGDKARVAGFRHKAEEWRKAGKAIMMGPISGGFFEMGGWLRGYERFYADLALDPKYACALMDKNIELRKQYWDMVLDEIGEYIDVIIECEDVGGQNRTIISPEMWRKYVKPRQKEFYGYIKKRAPHAFLFLHSCGSVYEVIPDFIDVGVDILNPVQVSAGNMDTKKLKKEFGDAITFWGGGVDTQRVLPKGTPQEVKDEVRRRIEDLAPGGGFVFNTVHNIQGDVPPENIVAMWEAVQEYGVY